MHTTTDIYWPSSCRFHSLSLTYTRLHLQGARLGKPDQLFKTPHSLHNQM